MENKVSRDFAGIIMPEPVSGPGEKAVTVGYGLTPAYQKQGYAKEVLTCLFEKLKSAGTERISANIREQNLPSQKLVKKLGFYECGRTDHAHRNPQKNGEHSANLHFRPDLCAGFETAEK